MRLVVVYVAMTRARHTLFLARFGLEEVDNQRNLTRKRGPLAALGEAATANLDRRYERLGLSDVDLRTGWTL